MTSTGVPQNTNPLLAPSKTIHVGNLNAAVTPDVLRQIFSCIGSVVDVRVAGDGRYGFVDFADADAATGNATFLLAKYLDANESLGAPDTFSHPNPLADDERKEACYAQEFLQSTADGYAAVQFSRCNPLPCWYEPCLAGPDQRLITTRMGDIQAGGCAGVCYQVQGADTLRYPVSASPLPASANLQNKFATAVISKCGQATNDRPLITMKSLNVELAQNQDKRAQVAINNEGDTGVMVTVTTGQDQPWIGTNVQGLPTYVPARGSTQIVVEWDQSIVGVSSGKTFAGTVTVSYNDGVQDQQTQATVDLSVVDPVAPVVRTTKGIPREFIYGSAGLLVGAVVLAGFAFAKNSS